VADGRSPGCAVGRADTVLTLLLWTGGGVRCGPSGRQRGHQHLQLALPRVRNAFARRGGAREGQVAALLPGTTSCRTYTFRLAPEAKGLTCALAQKCSRFHELSAYNGPLRTCAEKLALQLERRRSLMLAQGRTVRARHRSDEPSKLPGATSTAESEEEEEDEDELPRRGQVHASRHERHLEPPAMTPSSVDGLDRDAQPSAPQKPPMAPQEAPARAGRSVGTAHRGKRDALAAQHAVARQAHTPGLAKRELSRPAG